MFRLHRNIPDSGTCKTAPEAESISQSSVPHKISYGSAHDVDETISLQDSSEKNTKSVDAAIERSLPAIR